jgi:hypothetical protein
MGDSNGWARFEWGHDWNRRVETSGMACEGWDGTGGIRMGEWRSAVRQGCDRIRI